MRRTYLPVVLVAATAASLLLAGCVWLKSGSVVLTQPGGIGGVHLRFSLCTTVATEGGKFGCGSEPSSTEGQFYVGLVVPAGTQAPETLTVTPGPGAGPLTLTRSSEQVAAALSSNPALAETGTVIPPPGSELVGYRSGVISEPAGQSLEWTVDANLGLPPTADGGSYGGPFRLGVVPASREVNPEFPASRPFSCAVEADPTFCSTTETPVELGTSELKIAAPASVSVAPGTQIKVPFTLDFASSSAALPTFSLAASSTLPRASLRLPSATFSRAPTNTTTKRAPATTRKVVVTVPPSARPGGYELALTATTAQGGSVTGIAKMTVKPPLRARLNAPRRVTASVASAKGIPVRVVMPVAGSKLTLRLLGPRPNGSGQAQLKKAVRKAKAAGPLPLFLKLPRTQALSLLADEARLTLRATISIPGVKPRKLTRTLQLR